MCEVCFVFLCVFSGVLCGCSWPECFSVGILVTRFITIEIISDVTNSGRR